MQNINMSKNNKKQFGVWMDSRNATIVGKEDVDQDDFTLIAQVSNAGADNNSSENAANNQEIALTQKYFKEIMSYIPNVDEIHLTGTGQIQEQLVKYLADTSQYKNVVATESTSNKMGEEELITYMSEYFK